MSTSKNELNFPSPFEPKEDSGVRKIPEKPVRSIEPRERYREFKKREKEKIQQVIDSWKELGESIVKIRQRLTRNSMDSRMRRLALKHEADELADLSAKRPRGISDEDWEDFTASCVSRIAKIREDLSVSEDKRVIVGEEQRLNELEDARKVLEESDEVKEWKAKERIIERMRKQNDRERKKKEFAEWTELLEEMKTGVMSDFRSERRAFGFLPRLRAIHPSKFDISFYGNLTAKERSKFDELSLRLFPNATRRFRSEMQGLEQIRRKGIYPERELFEHVISAYELYLERRKWEDVEKI